MRPALDNRVEQPLFVHSKPGDTHDGQQLEACALHQVAHITNLGKRRNARRKALAEREMRLEPAMDKNKGCMLTLLRAHPLAF